MTAALKVQTLVVKVASRCNLNCSYCFMYNLGDDTWRNQPKVMPPEVVQALMARVSRHCHRHGLTGFGLILHGGEPLLAGTDFLVHFVTEARRALLPAVKPYFALQTNGTLLTPAMSALLRSLDVRVGVSLDGPPEVNDRHRLDHAGRSSYQAVVDGIACAREAYGQTPKLLSVINLDADPLACYEHFRALGARDVDFLFPDATHDQPPPGHGRSQTPYADWLIRIFDRWFQDRPRAMSIRLLEEIITTLCGGRNALDLVGTGRNEVLIVETDGGLEPVDSLKVCGDGFTKTRANVRSHELDDALGTELAQAYHLSGERACETCQVCPLHRVCGGGYLPHRHSRQRGFDNVSVYCGDLMKLIIHIQNRLCQELPGQVQERLGLTPLVYQLVRGRLQPASSRRLSLPVMAASGRGS